MTLPYHMINANSTVPSLAVWPGFYLKDKAYAWQRTPFSSPNTQNALHILKETFALAWRVVLWLTV